MDESLTTYSSKFLDYTQDKPILDVMYEFFMKYDLMASAARDLPPEARSSMSSPGFTSPTASALYASSKSSSSSKTKSEKTQLVDALYALNNGAAAAMSESPQRKEKRKRKEEATAARAELEAKSAKFSLIRQLEADVENKKEAIRKLKDGAEPDANEIKQAERMLKNLKKELAELVPEESDSSSDV